MEQWNIELTKSTYFGDLNGDERINTWLLWFIMIITVYHGSINISVSLLLTKDKITGK